MADQDVSQMKVVDLKRELKRRGLKILGIKKELAECLQSALLDDTICELDQAKRGVKKRKLNQVQKSTNIFALPIEILEYIFDYLDLRDLIAVGQTCKWMHQVAGGCYEQNYAGLDPGFILDEKREKGFHVEFYFFQFFDKIEILQPNEGRPVLLYKFLELQSEFHRLKKLKIRTTDFTNVKIDDERLRQVLTKVRYLNIAEYCKMEESFLENILAVAPNIKRLSVEDSRTGVRWLSRSYPTLEHCEIASREVIPIATFLALNPNVRKFGTNLSNLWENRHLIQAADIKLDDLAILIERIDVIDKLKFRSLCQSLNELNRIGRYKRLKLFIFTLEQTFNQEMIEEISKLTAFVRLRVFSLVRFDRVALSDLVQLEDLEFPDSRFITDIKTVAIKLGNLERIHFGISNLCHVKLFMSLSLKLQIMRVDWFMDDAGNIERKKVLNLFELDKVRATLPNAKKITLYVEENVYLATKCANRETDLDFIKLKRWDSFNDDNFDFYYYRPHFTQFFRMK